MGLGAKCLQSAHGDQTAALKLCKLLLRHHRHELICLRVNGVAHSRCFIECDPEARNKDYPQRRASGVKLPNLPENDPKFLAAYMEASQSAPVAKRNGQASLEAAIQNYLKSPSFKSFSTSYASLMRRECKKLVAKAGHVPFRTIGKSHILGDLSKLEPNAANKRLKAWRGVCGANIGLLRDDNPTKGIKATRAAVKLGHVPWDASDIAKFRKHYGYKTPERMAFELIC